mgnify:CR=1 FL=1
MESVRKFMTNITDPKPCGNYHPLPCGLDVDCEVSVKYFEPEKTSEEIYEEYNE